MEIHSHHDEPDMLSVEEARARILAMFQPLLSEEIDLLSSLGQVLDEDIVVEAAPLTNPLDDLGVGVLTHEDFYRVAWAETAQHERNKGHDEQNEWQPQHAPEYIRSQSRPLPLISAR